MSLVITHQPEQQRFVFVEPDSGLASVCEYRLINATMAFTHTEVPNALAGRGIAAALVEAALVFAREQGLKVRPLCSYVASYMRRHAATQDLLEDAT
jgi:predicted GNAT family acetyltransferase